MKNNETIPQRNASARRFTRRALLIDIVSCLPLTCLTPALAQNANDQKFNIERQPIIEALKQLHHQTAPTIDFQYLPTSAEEEKILVGPLKGRYSLDAALTELLAPIGFSHMWVDQRRVRIISRRASLRW